MSYSGQKFGSIKQLGEPNSSLEKLKCIFPPTSYE